MQHPNNSTCLKENILMRPFLLFLTTTISTLLSSCDPCNNLDCASSNYDGQFRIVSAATGKDLVFGANKIYDKNQIKFYSLNATDTTFFEYQTIKFGGPGYDSVLHVRLSPQTDIALIQILAVSRLCVPS